MKDLFAAGRLLLSDLASTVFFLLVFLLTRNLPLAVALGMALGIGQIGSRFVQKKPIEVIQWMSLVAVLGAGVATLISDDPRFVMVKPSLIYVMVGVIMLKPGWMNRYLPPAVREKLSDIAVIFGFVWSGLMFVSAALNLLVALHLDVVTWSVFMTIYGIASKFSLVLIQHVTIRYIRDRRTRIVAMPHRPAGFQIGSPRPRGRH
jgi:intracellular septation protein A